MLTVRICGLCRRFNNGMAFKINRLATSATPHSVDSTKNRNVEDDNAPIKYTSSAARNWQAKDTRVGVRDTRLWYEPYVIIVSVAIFLIYFTIVREENDVDEELNRSLYSRIKGLEEHQLRVALEYNRDNSLDTTAIIKRLEELEQAKTK